MVSQDGYFQVPRSNSNRKEWVVLHVKKNTNKDQIFLVRADEHSQQLLARKGAIKSLSLKVEQQQQKNICIGVRKLVHAILNHYPQLLFCPVTERERSCSHM